MYAKSISLMPIPSSFSNIWCLSLSLDLKSSSNQSHLWPLTLSNNSHLCLTFTLLSNLTLIYHPKPTPFASHPLGPIPKIGTFSLLSSFSAQLPLHYLLSLSSTLTTLTLFSGAGLPRPPVLTWPPRRPCTKRKVDRA